MYIRNAWYAAAISSELGRELMPRKILGEPIVFYRTEARTPVALADRCAHRQVPLSKGRLIGDDVQCWYHGLRFAPSGQCVHIPSQDVIPQSACVRAYPVAERHGLIWIWMGDEQPDSALIPDHWVCADPQLAGDILYMPIHCDYLFGIDNILDISHAAFVHERTLGSMDVAATPPSVVVEGNVIRVHRTIEREPAPPLYRKIMQVEAIDRTQEVIYWPVGNTRVDTVAYPAGTRAVRPLKVYTTTIFTPASERSTHVFVGMHRDFAVDNAALTKMIMAEVEATVVEDKEVTEHLQANWLDEQPLISIKLDRAAIAARRILGDIAKTGDGRSSAASPWTRAASDAEAARSADGGAHVSREFA